MIDALLIYPKLGNMDSMVIDPPLSILYAASDSVKRGYKVECVDMRTVEGDWKAVIDHYLAVGVRLIGLSVMTGRPCKNSRDVCLYVRSKAPDVKIVWGGPHPTVLPETLEEPYLDYLIRGYGSQALAELIEAVRGERPFEGIMGLSYHDENGNAVHTPRKKEFEKISYKDIPYSLINVKSERYARSYNGKRMFPIFTSIGCPYQCSFCVHPSIYKEINGKKWLPLEDEDVLEHIKFAVREFNANHIVFIDDTSFPQLPRMKRLLDAIAEMKEAMGLDLTLEFRGARINEIEKMDDEFIETIIRAGGRLLMAGVESGSDRILKSFQKGISRNQVMEANRKLARFPMLKVYYNFIYGTPGETYQDLLDTKELAVQLVMDNPNAYFGFGGDWKPIPGTKTLEIAEQQFGYRAPKTMNEWIEIDSSDADQKIVHPWYTRDHNDLIKLLQVSSWVIDDKLIKESEGNTSLFFRLIRTMSRIYKPIALFRLRHNFHRFMIEYEMYMTALRLLPRMRAILGG